MRVLTLDDVRFSTFSCCVTAAPVWAYAKVMSAATLAWLDTLPEWYRPVVIGSGDHGSLEPIPEVWKGVLAELEAIAEADHQARVQFRLELGRAIASGTASEWEEQAFAVLGRSMSPKDIPRLLWVGSKTQTLRCRVCGEAFHAARTPRRLSGQCCSARCLRKHANGRWRRSRAKRREDRPSGAAYTPTRADARFCSVRCRVAHHRAAARTRVERP